MAFAYTGSCTSACSETQVSSPSSRSWDGIFEASDLVKRESAPPSHNEAVKRALFPYQSKGDNNLPASPRRNLSLKSITKCIYPSHLKILAAKLALNSGKPHISSRGKMKMGRQLRKPCPVSCNRCEIPRLTDPERATIFHKFWSLANHEEQWKFIYDSVKVTPPKRNFAVKGTKGKKNYIRSYFLTVDGVPRKLCKTMFINTLCICDSWISNALSHFHDGKFVPDLRGKIKLQL